MSETSETHDFPEPVIDELTAAPGGPPTLPTYGAKAAATAQEPGTQDSRGMVRTIHYNLSYVVRNAARGPRGAIVLLHDFPGGAFTWADVLPALEATGRAVYAFDLLGYGQSDFAWPSDTSVWGHGDCLQYAFQALGLRDVTLVGLGQGAAVAQVLATRLYFGQVAKLVLINSYAYEYAFAPNWPLPEMEKRHDPEAPKHTPLDAVLADLRNTLPQGAANTTFLAGSKLDAYVGQWNSEIGKEMLFQHARLMLPLYLNSVGSDLKKLDYPVMVVWGEKDAVTPPALGERLAREIPGARFELLKGAGHMVLDEAPDAVGRLLADFIGK